MENIKCECNQKELCVKMRNDSLKKAVEALREQIKFCDKTIERRRTTEIPAILEAIENVLKTYDCMPCSKLLERVKCVKENSREIDSYYSYITRIEMLITEIEVFLETA